MSLQDYIYHHHHLCNKIANSCYLNYLSLIKLRYSYFLKDQVIFNVRKKVNSSFASGIHDGHPVYLSVNYCLAIR